MENKRPTYKDPAEFALIKQIYFKDNRPTWEDLDPQERLDRMEAKQRYNAKSNR
ncbi:hypothetical protein M0R04_13885 [Candidatus Dojkabacteria bacterium]|jgi:hypothetical protein|nr:hypothetical protein [Candidatus Dojkabacteria bacterium]